MKMISTAMKTLAVAALVPLFLIACGSSSDTTAASGDTTPPVTTASPSGGTYTGAQTITFTCTDTGGQCLFTLVSDDGGNTYTNVTDYSISGATTSHSEIVGQVSSGTYTLKFLSIDDSNNAESLRTETYVIQ